HVSGGNMEDLAGLTVEFNEIGETTPDFDDLDGVTITNDDGSFTYLPIGLTTGATAKLAARVVVWDDFQKAFAVGETSHPFEFDYDPAPPLISPEIINLAPKYGGAGPVNPPTITGQVVRWKLAGGEPGGVPIGQDGLL